MGQSAAELAVPAFACWVLGTSAYARRGKVPVVRWVRGNQVV